jgi:hypothetical protein
VSGTRRRRARPGARVAPAIAAAAVAIGTLASAGARAEAATEGPCSDPDGVTVVVDFQRLGGGVHVRCAPGPVSSGFDALSRAGISYRTALRQPGFLCRIAEQPANDPCIDTSPASAYWSYWLAPRGGTWCYANFGAGNRVPPPGTVEGWSFALDATASSVPPPSVAPPPPLPGIAPTPVPARDCTTPASSAPPPTAATPVTPGAPPVTDPASPPATGPTGASAGPVPVSGAGPTGPAATTPDAPPSAPSTTAAGTLDRAGTSGAERAERSDEAAPTVDLDATPEAGSPVAVAAGAGLVATLGAGALVFARARRRGATGAGR